MLTKEQAMARVLEACAKHEADVPDAAYVDRNHVETIVAAIAKDPATHRGLLELIQAAAKEERPAERGAQIESYCSACHRQVKSCYHTLEEREAWRHDVAFEPWQRQTAPGTYGLCPHCKTPTVILFGGRTGNCYACGRTDERLVARLKARCEIYEVAASGQDEDEAGDLHTSLGEVPHLATGQVMPYDAIAGRCTQIADEVVPEYRSGSRNYACTGHMARRWQAAWDGACVALGHEPKNLTPLVAKLVLAPCDHSKDWWIIERQDNDGREWVEYSDDGTDADAGCSARIVDGDIEGSSYEMSAVAQAIEQHSSVRFKRCQVTWTESGYLLSRPRGGSAPAFVTHGVARGLAADIRNKIKGD